MTAAVGRTKHTQRKIWMATALVAVGLGSGMCLATAEGPKRVGPLTCDQCQLGRPLPDVSTRAFLSRYESALAGSLGPLSDSIPAIGDVVVICNSQGCVDYQKTHSSYDGSNFRPQETTPPGGSHGAGSGDGNGSSNDNRPPAGGGWTGGGSGGGSGTVTVGGPSPNKPGVPNQDN